MASHQGLRRLPNLEVFELSAVTERSSSRGNKPLASQQFAVSQWLVFAALIGVGVALRFSLQSWSNFSPVAGIALAAGMMLRNHSMALIVPLSIMSICDWFIGGYETPVMISVYACLMLPSVMGVLAKRWLSMSNLRSALPTAVWGAMTGVALGLVSATVFFLVTNAAHWVFRTDGSLSLMETYALGLPFFRPMLQADVLFGAIGMSVSAVWLTRTQFAQASQAVAVPTAES